MKSLIIFKSIHQGNTKKIAQAMAIKNIIKNFVRPQKIKDLKKAQSFVKNLA